MASASGCQLAYAVKKAENAKSSGEFCERSTLLVSGVPRGAFGRSRSLANLQAAKKNVNGLTRCESSTGRLSAYQTFDSYLNRHLLDSNSSGRFSKSLSNIPESHLKRIQSCPDLSDNESEVEYEIKCQDGECDTVYKTNCAGEECVADGHKNCENNRTPSRRITGLFSGSASITQALTNNGRLVTSSIIQAARPAFRYSFVNGFAGIVMAFFLAAASVFTALNSLHSNRFSGSKDCHKCRGEGSEVCKICQGKGGIVWEGKLFHYDPCPSCFGTGLVKCAHCKPRRFKSLGFTPAGLGLGVGKA